MDIFKNYSYYLLFNYPLPHALSQINPQYDLIFNDILNESSPNSYTPFILPISVINPKDTRNLSHSYYSILPNNASFNLTTHFTLLNYFNVFYHWIMFYSLVISNSVYRHIDKGFLESFGPNGLLLFLHYVGFNITSFSSGFIPHYAYVLIFSISIFLLSIPFFSLLS